MDVDVSKINLPDGYFKLKLDTCFLDNNDIVVSGKGIEAQVKSMPEHEYNVLMKTEKRLPRKRKKWLKKFGGWEYYLQVPRKGDLKPATVDDFNDVMNALMNKK